MSAVALFAQSGVRPRVAVTPTPPVMDGDTSDNPGRSGAPPVLGGRNMPSARPDASATPTPRPNGDDDPNEVIKIQTNLVTMPVSVLDRDGRFVSGLTQRDFQIFEDGVEQKVDYFQSVEQPFTVILMLDVSPSTAFRMDEIHNAAITFVRQLRPDDRVMVMEFDERARVLCRPTNDRRVLENAIYQAEFGDGTSLYEAVDQAINRELSQIQGRKAVVLFSDGVDTTSRRATYQGTLADVEETDALFYTIRYDTQNDGGWGGGRRSPYPSPFPAPYPGRRGGGNIGIGGVIGIILGGGGTFPPMGGGGRPGPASQGGRGTNDDYQRGREYLETLSRNSGGRSFEADSTQYLDAAFSGIAEELRRQYSLGYYPDKIGRMGDRKQIRIRVMRPNLVVRAKNTYVVGQSDRGI